MAKPIIGIDIGSSSIKGVKLVPRREKVELVDYAMKPLRAGAIKDGEVIEEGVVTEALREISNKLKPARCTVVAAISGEQAVVRNIKMPKLPRNEIKEALPWEIEEYLSFPLDEAVIDFVIEKESENNEEKQLEIMAVATRKRNIENLLEPLRNAGFRVNRINLQTFALYHILKLMGLDQENLALADIGASATDLILMNEGLIEQHRTLPIGGDNFSRALSNHYKVSLEEGEKIKLEQLPDHKESISELEISFGDLADEFSRSLAHFQIQHRGLEIEKMYLAGGASLTEGLFGIVENRLDVPVSFLDIKEGLALGRGVDADNFAEVQSRFFVSLGLALCEVKA